MIGMAVATVKCSETEHYVLIEFVDSRTQTQYYQWAVLCDPRYDDSDTAIQDLPISEY